MKRSLAIAYTRRLLKKYGLKDWDVKLNDKLTATLGLCQFDDKLIEVNKMFVDHSNWSRVKETVLHEIAHALCPASHTHSLAWKMVAKLIGCKELTASTDFDTLGARYKKAVERKKIPDMP